MNITICKLYFNKLDFKTGKQNNKNPPHERLTHPTVPTLESTDPSITLSTRELAQQEMCTYTLPAWKKDGSSLRMKLKAFETWSLHPSSWPPSPFLLHLLPLPRHSSCSSCTLSSNKISFKKNSQNNLCSSHIFVHMGTFKTLLIQLLPRPAFKNQTSWCGSNVKLGWEPLA